ncbi:hypothetical protein HD554DRAFT_2040567 [Boletus coccyginus]|nr:hypothetical protein HD554DRAFT_2040567 [Boletus coccyginus]
MNRQLMIEVQGKACTIVPKKIIPTMNLRWANQVLLQKTALVEAIRANQKLAHKAFETFHHDVEEWAEKGHVDMLSKIRGQQEAVTAIRKELEVVQQKNEEEKEKMRVQKENEVTAIKKQYKYDLQNIQDNGLASDADTELIANTKEPGPLKNKEYKGNMWTSPAEYLRRILMENLFTKLEESPQFPPKSREDWENTIGEKFTCIKALWTKAQPQMTDAGKVEDPDEVEECRIEDTEKRLKRIRV